MKTRSNFLLLWGTTVCVHTYFPRFQSNTAVFLIKNNTKRVKETLEVVQKGIELIVY